MPARSNRYLPRSGAALLVRVRSRPGSRPWVAYHKAVLISIVLLVMISEIASAWARARVALAK